MLPPNKALKDETKKAIRARVGEINAQVSLKESSLISFRETKRQVEASIEKLEREKTDLLKQKKSLLDDLGEAVDAPAA